MMIFDFRGAIHCHEISLVHTQDIVAQDSVTQDIVAQDIVLGNKKKLFYKCLPSILLPK